MKFLILCDWFGKVEVIVRVIRKMELRFNIVAISVLVFLSFNGAEAGLVGGILCRMFEPSASIFF